MLFSKLIAAVSFVGSAFASTLAKRATEGIHLVNCGVYSAIIYCANDSNCGFNPNDSNKCVPNPGAIETWEGGSRFCTFSTGITFDWDILSNAQSSPLFSIVGGGLNGFQSFIIRRDDDHIMYTDGNGNRCASIYYCLDGVPPILSAITFSTPITTQTFDKRATATATAIITASP